jgi:uncharacterized protein YuzE
MNPQEAILKIKALFDDNIAPIEVEAEVAPMVEESKVEMAEYSLMDGTKVEISALEIGGLVTLEGEPAPVGDHELMDGTEITLDENGKITAIETKVVEASPEVDVEAGYDKNKEEEMAEAFNAKIAELIEANDAKIAKLENKVKQGFAQVAELIEAISSTPTEDPIKKPSSFTEFVNTKSIKEQRIDKYRQAILNNKN